MLVSTLPPGSIAYVDSDWLPTSSQPVASLAISADGALSWCDGPALQAPTGSDPDIAAARTLLAVAREAAAAVAGFPPRSVEVTGHGLIARQIGALAGDSIVQGMRARVERPLAIVDTTGRTESIVAATRRVDDLGTVVLAGEVGRPVDLDLYPDVHLRGLTLVGVGSPLQPGDAVTAENDSDEPLLEWCRKALVRVLPGAPAPAGAAWYRLDADESASGTRPRIAIIETVTGVEPYPAVERTMGREMTADMRLSFTRGAASRRSPGRPVPGPP